ncbi:MAG: type IV pilus twitching motility protein PilT [Planctomycetota bacterium]|nr:MAG: type IV pilus twitching motility protein PilT [Planctomycetota bacterium]
MTIQIEKLLELAIDKKASDIHIEVGRPPTLRINGRLKTLNTPPLTPDDTMRLMKSISSERCQQELNEQGGSDFGFAFGEKARFRVSLLKQKGNVGMVLRQISNTLLSLEEIGLPPIIKTYCLAPRGLFLVTGPTGSGKSTTLASMIDFINQEVDRHIITIEDPIEFYHTHKKSIVIQREINVDVTNFSEALRRALRQDPDVILVGEMRDLETISAAITAAETGHLVFGTLHTTGAAETVNRIIDAFPTNQQAQVRAQLSVGLLAVLSQTLLPRLDGKGRIAAFELMVVTPAISHLIRENQTHRITSAIQTGAKYGMQLLDDHLFRLFKEKKIKYSDMMAKCVHKEELQRKVKAYTAEQNAKK